MSAPAASPATGNGRTTPTAAGGARCGIPITATAKISPPLAAPDELLRDHVQRDGRHRRITCGCACARRATRRRTTPSACQFDDAIDQYRIAALSDRVGAGRGDRAPGSVGHVERLGMGRQRLAGAPRDADLLLRPPARIALRIQQRSDGAIVDQIILSPDAFLTSVAGRRRGTTRRSTAARSTARRRRCRRRRRSQSPPPVPAPWQQQDIGAVGMPGYARVRLRRGRFHASPAPAPTCGGPPTRCTTSTSR